MRVLKWVLALLVFLAVLAAVILWTLPARVAWKHAAPHLPMVQLDAPQGSVWRGQARQLVIAGEPLGSLVWRTDPLALLHGEVRVHVAVEDVDHRSAGLVTRERDGALRVNDARVEVDSAFIADLLDRDHLSFAGPIQLHVAEARLRNGWPETLRGTGIWPDARVRAGASMRLGDISFTLAEPEPPRIEVRAADSGTGDVHVDGHLSVTPAQWQVRVGLAPRDPADLRTREALAGLAPARGDGSIELRAEGRLLAPPR